MKITVLDILEETAVRYADKTAFTDEKESVTYGQLVRAAQCMGRAVCDRLGLRNTPVPVFMEKSCKCIVTMLGLIYSGNAYVPMDVKTPLERMNSIMNTLGHPPVITTAAEKRILDRMGYEGEIYIYEDLMEAYEAGEGGAALHEASEDDAVLHTASEDDTVLRSAWEYDAAVRLSGEHEAALRPVREDMIDTDLMYVLFTSGSTGEPKGVAVTHRSLVDYLYALQERMQFHEDDIIGNQTPFYSDMSIRDIFSPMLVGASAYLIPQRFFMTPLKLLECMEENDINMISWVPTAYRMVSQFKALERIRPSKLRKFVFGGEAVPINVYQYWREHYPEAEYIEAYGPTEITGVCTIYNITRDYAPDEVIPVGTPLKNTRIMLLGEEDRLIAPGQIGVTGEICVCGTCLAAGYYNDKERTAAVFVLNPLIHSYESLMYRTGDLAKYDEEGNLVFVSRKDFQVKHGGKRIELGEIEAAVNALTGVAACCCVHHRLEDELVLYYIGEISEKEIMLGVRSRLPKYMIPMVYHQMDELPTLPNGKLDRKRMDAWVNG